MDKFERIFGQWVVNHRWWIILATVIVVATSASGMRFLTVNNDTRAEETI
jgi:predicted RND superfamily exporter protein